MKRYKAPIKSHLLTKERDSLILGQGNDVHQSVNKQCVNVLQAIPWEINESIIDDLRDTLKPSEDKLSHFEEAERGKAYTLRDRETNDVIDYLLENGNKFYFGWKYDKRGRLYSQGYHVNPQGNEYRKAMLQFSDKEYLTTEGIRALKYAIAETMGYDKATWITRTMKANKAINDIFSDMPNYQVKVEAYANTAGEPLLFRKFINAWKEGVIEGKAIGTNIGADASASGIQIMSALSSCPTSARHSNVHPMIERNLTQEAQDRIEALEEELAKLTK